MRNLTAFLRENSTYVVTFYIVLFIVLLATSFFFYLSNQRHSQVLYEARSYSQTLVNIHSYYSGRILPLTQFQGIPLTSDPDKDLNKLPFPGSFIRQAAQSLGSDSDALEVKLYSRYPFNYKSPYELDRFQEIALDLFEEDITPEYSEIVVRNGQEFFRYSTASLMEASCVVCHNRMQREEKLDYPFWNIGDVRGGIEINIAMPPIIQSNTTLVWLFGACVLITTLFGLLIILPVQKDMKHAMDEAQHLSEELDVRNRILLEQNKEKNNFLANVSHELRTPLNAIIGFADIQSKELYGPIGHDKYKSYNNDIMRSGTHLLGLIENLLDLSQLETGDQPLHESPINYDQFMADIEAMTQGAVHRANMSISYVVRDGLPILLADERALKQVMINLIINATKYSHGKHIHAGIDMLNDRVCLSVLDDGLGIEQDKLEHLTRRFYRAKDAKQSGKGGFGIGLWLVDAICQAHGAELTIKSIEGEGSEFTVVFPKFRLVDIDQSMHKHGQTS